MTDYIRSPLFQLKVGELVLSLICAGLLFLDFPAGNLFFINIIHLTVFGYILLNILVIVSVVIQEPLSRSLFLLVNGSGGLLFLLSGIFMIADVIRIELSYRILIAGIISLLNGIVYAADTYYIVMFFQD